MKRRVADIVIDTLVEYGITDCFGVVGGGAMHLDNALALNDNMNKIFNHHEQASAMAAEAYARVSGKMAAVCVTSGPGATNTLTGVMGAWQDSLPMIVLSGQVRYAISVPESGLNLRYRGIQEFQIVPTVKNMTKYAVMITEPLAIKKELVKAINIAMDGRRGPVWLDIPLDVQSAEIDIEELYSIEPFESHVPAVSSEDILWLFNRIEKAARPCLLLGSGVISGGCRDRVEGLVKILGIPVVGGSWVGDVFYLEHELYFGQSGNIGPRTGNFILQNADLIISVGNSLGFRQTGFNQENFAPYANIVMIDADAEESKKSGLKIEKFIHASVGNFIDEICKDNYFGKCESEWLEYCTYLKKRFSPFEGADGIDLDERVCSYQFWKEFQTIEEEDSILALGNNTANSAKLQIGIDKPKKRLLTNYTCGSMGYDIPAALGAAVATKRKIYCITGDGSIMMNLQELQTIVQYDLPVNVVVFSNDGYNAIRQTSKNFFKGVYIGCTADTGVSFPSFKNVAYTYGFEYMSCNTNRELSSVLTKFVNSKKRVLLEVMQRLDDPVVPKVMSRVDENGKMLSASLEDMAPFISKDEHDKLMKW